MKLISKRNYVFIMVIFLLFMAVASVSATDVSIDDGNLTVDTLSSIDDASISDIEEVSSDDSILYSTNADEELSATIEESGDSNTLGAHDDGSSTSDIDVYEPNKDYTENHVYAFEPKPVVKEFLSHIREISPGYIHTHHETDVYWTSVENETMYFVFWQDKDKLKNMHLELELPSGKTLKDNDITYFRPVITDSVNHIDYNHISVVKVTGVTETGMSTLYVNRNGGNPFTIEDVPTLNSTEINLTVNDKLEDTIWLGENATLQAIVYVLNHGNMVPATEGIVHYNVTDVNGTAIINEIGTSAPGGTIIFHPDYIGDYIFKAWFEDHLGEENFESHSNTVILHVVAPPKADLSVEKTVDNAAPYVGEEVTFTITVTNNGPNDATGVKVTDELPDGLIYVSDDSNGDYNPDTGVWTIGNLSNKDSATLKIVAIVNTTFANNTAKVSAKENDTNSSNDEDYAIVNAYYSVILNITKVVNDTEVYVGDQVEFTITVTNLGKSNATNVNITDELNAAFEYVSSTPEATIEGKKLTWTIDKLTPNDPKTFKIVVIVKTPGTFNNTAVVVSKENSTEVNDTTKVSADTVILNITKTANVTKVHVDQQVEFTITVENIGTANLTNVVITDELNAAFDYVSSTPEATVEGKKLTWTIDKLTPNDSKTFKIVVIVKNPGLFTNTAIAVCSENTTEVKSTVNVAADTIAINITKTADVTELLVEGQVEFTITVENIGTGNATNVVITDELDAAFDYVSSTPEATVEGKKLTWTIGNLAPEASQTFKVIVTVNKQGTFNNTAIAVCSENTTEVKDTAEVTANTVILNITKTANVTEVYVGDKINFTITVINTGTTSATEAIISDPLDFDVFEYVESDGDWDEEIMVTWYIETLGPNESFSGWVVVTVKTNGTFNNTAFVVCNENETVTNNTSEIKSNKLNMTIVVGNYTTTPGRTVTVEITVTAENGESVNCTLYVEVTGPESTDSLPPHEGILLAIANDLLGAESIPVNIENGKGSFTYDVPIDAVKDTSYVVTATLKDNPRYKDSEGTGYIDVIQYETNITVSNATKYPGDEVEVTFTVETEDNVPFNGDINVTLPDGSTTSVKITDGTGKYTWTVPKDAQKGDEYVFKASYAGNGTYLPSNGTGTVKVIKLKTTTTVSNATGKPEETVTLTVKVTTEDGTPFNGEVVVKLPNGKSITVTIKDGVGTFDWTIPKDATDDSVYKFTAYCNGDLIYMESEGTGFVDVVAEEDNNTSTNGTTTPAVKATMHNTGNPLVVLLAAIIFLGFGLKRREDE